MIEVQMRLYCKRCRKDTNHVTRGAGRMMMTMCTSCAFSEHRPQHEVVAWKAG